MFEFYIANCGWGFGWSYCQINSCIGPTTCCMHSKSALMEVVEVSSG